MRTTVSLTALAALACCASFGCESKPKPAASPASQPMATTLEPTPLPKGWVELFNGRDLTGWKPFLADNSADPATVWSVSNGVLICEGKPAGYIATTNTYTSFELTLDWRFDAEKGAGNSGVLMRVQNPDKVWPRSVEAQLHSGNAGDIWNIDDFDMKTAPARTKGRWTGKMKPTNEKPLGEWNSYRIVLDGGKLDMWVNGELQNSATDVQLLPGRIALQSEGAHIEFRNIRLKPLDGPGRNAR